MTQAEALSILKTGATVFLTGEPGSGKTHTVNAYIAWLRSHGIDPSITASTGIAATHVGGMTIHSWSGIGIAERMTPELLDAIVSKEHVVKRLQKAKVLIIDEVSMLSGNVLSMVDEVLREARHTTLPMGGIQVVLVGDFFQLPPVSRRETSFAFQSEAWKTLNPIICYLTEQHRQEDTEFLEVLSAIRDASWNEVHVTRITAQATDHEGVPDDVPRLFTHNEDVDRINAEKLSALSGKEHRYVMHDMGPQVMTDALKRGCLSPELLALKEGAIVMCTKNNPALGFANGTLGTVVGFEPVTDNPVIETHDGREIVVQPLEWGVEEGGKVRAKITQIPLRLAWAITVHKSQGQSLDAAAIDLSRTFEYGQGYVALSRVRSLSGIALLGWHTHAMRVHPEVVSIDRSFRSASEQAVRAFAALDASGERDLMEQRFITASGGVLEVLATGERPHKKSTYEETLALIEEGNTLEEIALTRSLTEGTIADHLEKLLSGRHIGSDEIESVMPERIMKAMKKIRPAFDEKGTDKLGPVFAALKGKYSYDDLKLARLVILSGL